VRDRFTEEQAHLLALPANPFPCEQRIAVSAHKTPYVRFDLNDYSIPHTHVNRTLSVLASLQRVRILDAQETIATHPRSFDRGAQIEDPAHIAALLADKRAARTHRAQDRLQHAAPSAKALFMRAAEHAVHLGVLTRGLLQLLDSHGAQALEAAIAAALAEDAAHLGAVRHFIDQHAHARGQPPPIAVTLPKHPRLPLSVRPQPLSDYQQLATDIADEHDPAEPDPNPHP
jgi:hypothetical protein